MMFSGVFIIDISGDCTVNRMSSTILNTILSAVVLLSVTGCDKASDKTEISADNTVDTIKMITWTNDSTIDALETLNKKFYEETGINVELTHVPATEYEDLLKDRIASGDVDIFCYTTDSKAFAQPVVDWAPSEMLTWESIIRDGNALDLSGYDFISNWDTGAQACRYNDGIYGIATGMTIMNGIFYNRKLFDEHGWHEPKTWSEFVKLCEDMKALNIAPITAGGADTWPAQMITNAIVDSVAEGKCAELSEGLWKGSRTYMDDESLEIYSRELQFLSYMEDGFMNVTYEDGPKRLVSGEVAMLYDGSWNAAEIEKADPDFEYDYFAIPGDNRHNFTGKYDLTFGVNAKSAKADSAVKWLDFFSKPENYTIYIDYNGFVPTMSWISTSNRFLILIDDRIKDFERTYECYNRVPTDMGPYGTYDLINYSITGGVFNSPLEFAEAAQKDWDEALDKILAR